MQKQTVIFEKNPKWRIYKGKIFLSNCTPVMWQSAHSISNNSMVVEQWTNSKETGAIPASRILKPLWRLTCRSSPVLLNDEVLQHAYFCVAAPRGRSFGFTQSYGRSYGRYRSSLYRVHYVLGRLRIILVGYTRWLVRKMDENSFFWVSKDKDGLESSTLEFYSHRRPWNCLGWGLR